MCLRAATLAQQRQPALVTRMCSSNVLLHCCVGAAVWQTPRQHGHAHAASTRLGLRGLALDVTPDNSCGRPGRASAAKMAKTLGEPFHRVLTAEVRHN